MARLQTFLLLILLSAFSFSIAPADSAATGGLRLDLIRRDSSGNFTKLELVRRAAKRSHHRMARLTGRSAAFSSTKAAATSADIQSSVHAGNGEFLMDLAIGTPSVPLSAIVDTGSDLIWTQCKPCVTCFDQPTPIFDPSKSSTFATLPCSGELCQALPTSACGTKSSTCEYLYNYGDSSSTQGILGSETFGFGSHKAPSIGFGCGDDNQGSGFTQACGLVGLGRGPLSLISQLNLGKFSYCLTALDSTKKSPLMLGSLAELANGTSASVTTPLVKNPSQPSFYYLSLKAVTVGGILVTMPSSAFEIQEDGTGGMIIDSGTSITYLDGAGYKLVKKAFVSQVKLPVADGSDIGLDACFKTPSSGADSVEVPKLVLHFDGGADLDLPAENYMVIDSSSGLLCLTVMGSTGLSILGNFQQQNMQILYDLEKETLSFVPAQCDQV